MAAYTLPLPKLRLPAFLHLQDATKIWVSICLVIVTGAWRHFHTAIGENTLQEEVWVEWLSWVILLAAYTIFSPTARDEPDHGTRPGFWNSLSALWMSAAVLLSSQLLSSRNLPPWMVPLTTVAVAYTSSAASKKNELVSEPAEKDTSSVLPLTSRSMSTVLDPSNILMTVLLNIFCVFVLLLFYGYRAEPITLLQGAAFLILRTAAVSYIVRSQPGATQEQEQEQGLLAEPRGRSFLSQVSAPMVTLLTLLLIVKRPELSISSAEIFGQALAQAVSWYGFVSLIDLHMPVTVANLDTVGLSAGMALFHFTDGYGIAAALAVLLISVVQMICVMRASARARQAICLFVLGFVLALWALSSSRVADYGDLSRGTGRFTNGHPIENLINEKRAYFQRLQAKQSKTVDEAVKEYQRRYGRRPPLGFDKWFELAQEHDFVLPDEFDTFMQSLEPFNGIHPVVLQQRMDNVWNQSDSVKGKLARFQFQNGSLTIDDKHNIAHDALGILFDPVFTKIIPYNTSLLLNTWDEPMVNSPWAEVNKAIKDARDPTSERFAATAELTYKTPLIDSLGQSGWSVTRQGCSFDSPARQNVCHARQYRDPLDFISNVSARTNVCQQCELRDEHGLLLSSEGLHIMHELTPVFSTNKPSHFNDILCPSYWYFENDKYEPASDKKWEEKDNIFYWAGSSTGGHGTLDVWQKLQRQRLVLDTMHRPHKPIQLLEPDGPNSNSWSPYFTSMAEVANLFQMRVTRVVQSDDDAKEAQEAIFKTKDLGGESKESGYAHRFAIDIDGNGFSGRFYRLLKSNSVVVKSTILREWHDDRLIPWVHYVPLSMDFQELPEMARFLAKTEDGLKLSERIARESSKWHDKALRHVDLRLVFVRMVLEYARVLNPQLTY